MKTVFPVALIAFSLLAGCSGGTSHPNRIASITLSPATASIVKGQTQQFSGTATTNSGQTLTGSSAAANWSSSNPAVATIDQNGLATSVGTGTATITATVQTGAGPVTGAATLNVTPPPATAPVLTSIAISPSNFSVVVRATAQLTATGTYSDSSTQNLTSLAWSSANPAIATVDQNGMISAVGVGSTAITAQDGSVSGSTTVTTYSLAGLSVYPQQPSLAIGLTAQLTAVGTSVDNSVTGDVTNAVTWTSSDPGIATVSSGGVLTAVAAGSATITASVPGQQAETAITVPNAAGGWILNTNPTDSLIMWDPDPNGALAAFGTRDSTGTPNSITGFALTNSDGSTVTVRLNSSYQPATVIDSAGYTYDLQWSSPTAGLIVARSLDGKYVIPAYFNVADSAAIPAGRVAHPGHMQATPAGLNFSPTPLTVDVNRQASSAGGTCNTWVPESNATVTITVIDSKGRSTDYPAFSTAPGTYQAWLPTPSNAVMTPIAAAAEATAAGLQASNFCQSQSVNTGSKLSALLSKLIPVLFPEDEVAAAVAGRIGVLDSIHGKACSTPGQIASWLDRFVPFAVRIQASGYAGTLPLVQPSSSFEFAPLGGPFENLQLLATCQDPAKIDIVPSSIALNSGQEETATAIVRDSDGKEIDSSANSIAWGAAATNSLMYPEYGPYPDTPTEGANNLVTGYTAVLTGGFLGSRNITAAILAPQGASPTIQGSVPVTTSDGGISGAWTLSMSNNIGIGQQAYIVICESETSIGAGPVQPLAANTLLTPSVTSSCSPFHQIPDPYPVLYDTASLNNVQVSGSEYTINSPSQSTAAPIFRITATINGDSMSGQICSLPANSQGSCTTFTGTKATNSAN